MKERLLLAANGILFCAAILMLATMQTALWYQIFGNFPAPSLWICAIVFVGLYRPVLEVAIVTYASCVIVSTMTVMPLGLLMTCAISVALCAKFVKQRIYWPGSGYFSIVCASGALLFHIFHLIASGLFEDRALTSPEIGDWAIEALLTSLAALALHPLFWRFDRLTGREQPMEAGATR